MHHHELTADTPVERCKELFYQPKGPWPAGFEGLPNLCEAFRQCLKAERHRPMPKPSWEAPRGVVICGGGWRFFPGIFVTVRLLRERLKCHLPIQVWYLGDAREFDDRMRQALDKYDVGWIDAHSFVRQHQLPIRELGGWEMKPLAAAYAPYQTVFFLDADAYPTCDPNVFMDHPEFQRVGAAFWPDQGELEPGQWDRFGVPRHQEAAWETGQFVVDKDRHWDALSLTTWMNGRSDYVYRHIYGDKDTFHLCWRLCQREVCVPTQRPGWADVAFLQKDFDGQTLVVHRTRDKFRWVGSIDGVGVPQWYMTQQWSPATRFVPQLPHEEFNHDSLRLSDQLLRPENFFRFIGGKKSWHREVWAAVNLRNEYDLPLSMEGATVLDLGANHGAAAWACLRRGARHVVMVEPWTPHFDYVRENLTEFGVGQDVIATDRWPCRSQVEAARWTLLKCGAGATTEVVPAGESAFHTPGISDSFNLFLPVKPDDPTRYDLELVSLDELILATAALDPRGRVSLIKTDTEGAEYPAFATAKRLDLVDEVRGETHEDVRWDGQKWNSADLYARLHAAGFTDLSCWKNGPNTQLFTARRPA